MGYNTDVGASFLEPVVFYKKYTTKNGEMSELDETWWGSII